MSDSIQNEKKTSFTWKTATAIGAATWLVTTQLSGCAVDGATQGEGEGEGEGVASQSVFGGEGEGEGEGYAGEGEGEGEGEGGEGEGGEGEGYAGEGEGEGEGEGGEGEGGEGEGEGEGGEGEGAATAGANFATQDDAYLTQLGLIRGHLAVGYALYQQDLPQLAETHMKHPRAEIYATVAPAFSARGCDGFGDELTALTAAVTGRNDQADVDQVYENLTGAIAACERGAATDDPQVLARVIEDLLRTAGVEYEIGVVDGQMNNLHEYQDAWGFTQVALKLARSNAFARDAKATAVAAQVQDLLTGLQDLWPSLNPEGPLDGSASRLFGAAGQVQVLALGLR